MEFDVHTFRTIITLSMPIAGTMEQVMEVGDTGDATPDRVENWPHRESPSISVKRNPDRRHCIFRSEAFRDTAEKLIREEDERESALAYFRGAPEKLSWHPIEDPFLPAPRAARDAERIREAQATMVSLLMSDRVRRLVDEVPNELYPQLDGRIASVLPKEAVRLCASLVGFGEEDALRLACSALATVLREEAGIRVPEIENPSVPFQTVGVNDAALLAGHVVTAPLEEFEQLISNYVVRSREYWASVGSRKLYNADDIETLKRWNLIEGTSGASLIFFKAASPSERLDEAWASWKGAEQKMQVARNMAQKIGAMGIDFWFRSSWPPLDEAEADPQGIWLAREAARQLGYSRDVAEGHLLTWGRLREFIFKYLWLDLKGIPAALLADSSSREQAFAAFIVPPAVQHLMATQMAFDIGDLFGGTNLRQNQLRIPAEYEREFEERDLGGGEASVAQALRDPRNVELHISGLHKWRTGFEKALERGRPANSAQRILDYYEEMFADCSERLEQIRIALANVASINEVRGVVGAMLERMNGDTVNVGAIDLPPDARVTSVFVGEGEYLAAGRPVLAAFNRFRCNGRAFLSTEQLTDSPLSPMTVWRVALDGSPQLAPGISCVAIVGRVEPERTGLWVVDFELFAVLEFEQDGISNLPNPIPLSQRYVGLHDAATETALDAVEKLLASVGTTRLKLLDRLH